MVDVLIRGLSVLLVIVARLTIVLVIIFIFMLILRRIGRRRIEFIKEKFYEPTKKPVESDWGIRILYPSRPINKCIILYNNTRLPWGDKDELYYEKRIETNGSGFVRVPKAIQKEGARVRFNNGRKTLLKVKFEHLHTAKLQETNIA